MDDIFTDISKYYAAQIVANMLTVGKIYYQDGAYHFSRENVCGPYELVERDGDVTRIIHVIGEVHPRNAVERILEIDVASCLYLNENDDNGEIEVRSIHKGMGTAIYSKQECPLILWNRNYENHMYFDVIDIKNMFGDPVERAQFVAILTESLRDDELFPPLVRMSK
jgi:hypothetical protein